MAVRVVRCVNRMQVDTFSLPDVLRVLGKSLDGKMYGRVTRSNSATTREPRMNALT